MPPEGTMMKEHGWAAVADMAARGTGEFIETCEWEPYHERCPYCHGEAGKACDHCNGTGLTPWAYQRVTRVKTVGEVFEQLRGYLSEKAEHYAGTEWMDGIEEGLSVSSWANVHPADQAKLGAAVTALDYEQSDLDAARRRGGKCVPALEARVAEKQQIVDKLREKCRPLNEKPWPINARIVVFSVRGGSEGDYVHVEALDEDGKATLLMLAKTFMGRDAAWTAARRIADLLGV